MLEKAVNFLLVHAAIVLPLAVLAALLVSSTARAGAKSLSRFLARILFIAAVVALAHDGTRTLAGGAGFVMTPLGDHWSQLLPGTLEVVKTLVTSKGHALLWDPAAVRLLRLPSWLVLGSLGLALAWLGRRRREVPVFVN